MRRPHRYAIATVSKTHWTAKGGYFADSRYPMQGCEYLVSAEADKLAGQGLAGRRFLCRTVAFAGEH